MKTFSIFSATFLMISGLLFTSCNAPSKNLTVEDLLENSPKKTINNENQIATAQKDTYSDFQKFIKAANIKLDQNEVSLVKRRNDASLENNKSTGMNNQKIEELETNNNTLKMKLDDYVQNGSGNWKIFKSEFNCELDEIEIACNYPVSESK